MSRAVAPSACAQAPEKTKPNQTCNGDSAGFFLVATEKADIECLSPLFF